MKKIFILLLLAVPFFALLSCGEDDPIVTPIDKPSEEEPTKPEEPAKPKNAVSVKLGTYLMAGHDLFEFVTPIVTYTDWDGKHQMEITKEMCEEKEFELDDDLSLQYFTRQCEIEPSLIPNETNEVELTFVPKTGATADAEKKYNLDSSFSIDKYSYFYKGTIYMGNSINLNISIKVNIGIGGDEDDDTDIGLISGKNVQEYVEKLCATKKTYTVILNEDGKLTIENKE